MYPCKNCGDPNKVYYRDGSCAFCSGPRKIAKIYKRPAKCYNCDKNVHCWRVGSEWGSIFYAHVSSISKKIICKNCPLPRKCLTCHVIFSSGNELFRHLNKHPDHQRKLF